MAADEDTEDRWEHWLVHLLWATATRTSMLGEAALADSPLSLAGLGLLENLAAHPGITLAAISRRMPQTQQALSQVASRLEQRGYLERRLIRGGRGIGLHISDSGEEARMAAHAAIEALEASLTGALGTQRHQRLLRLLAEADATFRELAASARGPGRTASNSA